MSKIRFFLHLNIYIVCLGNNWNNPAIIDFTSVPLFDVSVFILSVNDTVADITQKNVKEL